MKEIYKLNVRKFVTEQGIPVVQKYKIGISGDVDGEFLTPEKITIRKDKIIIRFRELGIVQELHMTPDVEVFKRDKQDAEEIQTESK